jgi:hypothetical protein
MKKLTQLIARPNRKKRVVLVSVTLFLSLVLVVGSALAYAQFSGVIDDGSIKDPSKPYGDNSYDSAGSLNQTTPGADSSPFQNEGQPIYNTNTYPIVIRASLQEILTRYKFIESSTTNVPANWKPAVIREAFRKDIVDKLYEGWNEIPYNHIHWDDAKLGTKPEKLHVFYKIYANTFGCFSYVDIYDPDTNFVGIQPMSLHAEVYNAYIGDEILDIWILGNDPNFTKIPYYIDDATDMITTKTQWVSFSNTEITGEWKSDSTWEVSHPTLANVVQDWDASIPMLTLQSNVSVYLKAPELRQTITKNKWYYNASDGYFYYVGIVGYNELAPGLADTKSPVYDPLKLYTNMFSEIKYRVYGEALQANTDLVAAQWGLSFTPGSLGAAIFD